MSDIYHYQQGVSPLLVSIPHSGLLLEPTMEPRLSDVGKKLVDTDWFVDRLYDFLHKQNSSIITAKYSRYVIDLNRAADGATLYLGQSETGLCPITTFSDEEIYQQGKEPDQTEIKNRIEVYWKPYHQKIETELRRIKKIHGYALLWDAHSIKSEVPRFFAGKLPDLNIGTVDNTSCDPALAQRLVAVAQASKDYSSVLNGRFKGGYITRHYGRPKDNVHAVQLELAQCIYMNETPKPYYSDDKAASLKSLLGEMIDTILEFAPT